MLIYNPLAPGELGGQILRRSKQEDKPRPTLALNMDMNIKFMKEYLEEVAWELILNLKEEAGSRFAAYCILIEAIGAKDAERLDKSRDIKDGDALYFAAGICGDQFWSAFADRIQSCIDMDVDDDDLAEREAKMLNKLLRVTNSQ